jgi:hypothetical protein
MKGGVKGGGRYDGKHISPSQRLYVLYGAGLVYWTGGGC